MQAHSLIAWVKGNFKVRIILNRLSCFQLYGIVAVAIITGGANALLPIDETIKCTALGCERRFAQRHVLNFDPARRRRCPNLIARRLRLHADVKN